MQYRRCGVNFPGRIEFGACGARFRETHDLLSLRIRQVLAADIRIIAIPRGKSAIEPANANSNPMGAFLIFHF